MEFCQRPICKKIPEAAGSGIFTQLTFSADGRSLYATSTDQKLRVWDVKKGSLKYAIPAVNGLTQRNSFDFSRDGKLGAVLVKNQTLCIIDAKSGKVIETITNEKNIFISVGFSSNGEELLIADGMGLLIRNIKSKTYSREFKSKQFSTFPAFYSLDMKFVARPNDYNALSIWSVESGKEITTLSGRLSRLSGAVHNRENIATVSGDGRVRLWSMTKGALEHVYKDGTFMNELGCSPDGKMFFISGYGNEISVRDMNTGALIQKITRGITSKAKVSADNRFMAASVGDSTQVREIKTDQGTWRQWMSFKGSMVEFSNNAKYILSFSNDTVTIRDLAGRSVTWQFRMSHRVNQFRFTPDDRNLYCMVTSNMVADKQSVLEYSLNEDGTTTLKRTAEYKNNYSTNDASLSPNGKYLATALTDTSVVVWGLEKLTVKYAFRGFKLPANDVEFSADSRYLLAASADGTAMLWDLTTGTEMHNYSAHTASLLSASFLKNDERILTASEDNTCKIWNVRTGQVIYTFLPVDTNDFLLFTPQGYYQASPRVSKLLHYVTPDLKVITFEQLDVKYNRPDKVLQAIESPDSALIQSYRKAYDKRIRKLGIDTTSFRDGYSVPVADISNRATITYEQRNDNLLISIHGTDSVYYLDRFNIWVNEVPVFGQRGFNLKQRSLHAFDTTMMVLLNAGENRIETSVLNGNGTESYHMPFFVKYTPPEQVQSHIYFIGIGIDRFRNPEYNLNYSSKDIRDLARAFRKKFGEQVSIDTLFNEQVTVANVKALKEKLKQTNINDKVIISYSGHGILSRDYDYYLSTYAINFSKPEAEGLAYDELENLLDSIPARKKLLLIDACHSGEVDKDEALSIARVSDSLGIKRTSTLLVEHQEKPLGLINSFELMQNLFVNVAKSTGATVISAAAGNQYALERGDLGNGVFTYCILTALKNHPFISLSELKKEVGANVERITGGLQKPTSRNETINVDWDVW